MGQLKSIQVTLCRELSVTKELDLSKDIKVSDDVVCYHFQYSKKEINKIHYEKSIENIFKTNWKKWINENERV